MSRLSRARAALRELLNQAMNSQTAPLLRRVK
jgi:DNA-directed RNA polymerase specialized sigma24 family protein